MIKNRPTMLMILDGYGIRRITFGAALIAAAKNLISMRFCKIPVHHPGGGGGIRRTS